MGHALWKPFRGLVGTRKTLRFTPAIADVEVTARYAFENTDASSVTVKSIAPACSCVTASTSKQSVASGERGEIVAKYSIGDRIVLGFPTEHPKAIVVPVQVAG